MKMVICLIEIYFTVYTGNLHFTILTVVDEHAPVNMVSNEPQLQTSTSTEESSNAVESCGVPKSITYECPQDVCSNSTNILIQLIVE